ncbi:hypothetical protein [Urechidicola croceus]|uniref:Uncharacterized protein n=1 Tax=Urechidicola croceus TaxID=1850246 RepID=A0A1D8PAZ0_9FLAO|nr:hypothetical protein [Urechidicola croceus]AOW21744.1 hypothetical protein LPB138_14120 [Urechidicola croceus]
MKINWISKSKISAEEMNELLDLEYFYRKEITNLLLKDESMNCCDDFSCFTFDFDSKTSIISVSKETPEPYYTKLKRAILGINLHNRPEKKKIIAK